MKKYINKFSIIGLLIIPIIIMGAGCEIEEQQEEVTSVDEYVIDESDFVDGEDLISDIEKSDLDQGEIDGLILMREEEKLAKDVYITLGEKWDMKIFTNISASEQTHTDAVKVLLDRYGIDDPATDSTVGVFTSPELQSLYDQLIEQGEKSLVDALMVGATIEDLDIKDLNELLAMTDNEDLIETYNNLNRGSRNHLRAFMKQLDRNGGTYTPSYISQELFDEILAGEQESGDHGDEGGHEGEGGQDRGGNGGGGGGRMGR